MRSLIYSMTVSLDGFIAGPGGDISWSVPDEELHRFHNERVREVAVSLYGRRLYETMRVWETYGDRPEATPVEREFAEIWKATPQVVFSTTLDHVEGNAVLARGNAVEEVARLKEEDGGDLEVGGAGLAATLIAAGLVDDYRLFVSPVTIGAGTPFFPALEQPIRLELADKRTFGSGIVYLRYLRAGS